MKSKTIIYFIAVILFISCERNKKKYGVYFNATELRVNKASIILKGDSLFIYDVSDLIQSTSNNNFHLSCKIDENNKIQGKYSDGKMFYGVFEENNISIKIKSNDSSFICESYIDTLQFTSLYNNYKDKRKSKFESLSDINKNNHISNLLKNVQLGITLHPRIDNGFDKLPDGTRYIVITDYTRLSIPINEEKIDYFKQFAGIINRKTPLVVRISKRTVNISGNKFNDGGLSRRDIGEAYHYGNYDYNTDRKEVQFYYYDSEKDSIIEENLGYLIYENRPLEAFSFYSQDYIVTSPWLKFFESIEKYQTDGTTINKRKLRYLFSGNGGLSGYFDDGSIIDCPRCDFMKSNIDAMYDIEPMDDYKWNTNDNFLKDIKENPEGWVLIDYKWIRSPDPR